jgi:hypothetical protein
MALPDAYRAVSLLDFNAGAAASVALLNPLGAQLDALLAAGLGPFQASLAAQFNASLAAQASLSLTLSMGDFALVAQLKAAIAALAQLQAALAGGLAVGLPPIQLGLSAELSATASLAATLKAQLGGLQLLIKAALAVKIPAIRAAASLSAALAVGPFYVISFSGTTVGDVAAWLQGQAPSLKSPIDAGVAELPFNQPDVFGVLIFGPNPSFQASFGAIIAVPP